MHREEDLPSFRFVNVVWGAEYIRYFLDFSLASALSPNNLPYFSSHSRCEKWIYTRRQDRHYFEESPHLTKLCELMPVRFVDIEEVEQNAPTFEHHDVAISTMTRCHEHFIKAAADCDSGLIFMAPDTVWSDGIFKTILEKSAVSDVVFLSAIRTARKGFLQAITELCGDDISSVGIPPRKLVKMALANLHPLTQSLFWESPSAATWLSLLLWEVPGEGVVQRCFHMHPIMVRPTERQVVPHISVDGDYVSSACPNCIPEFLVDSDDGCVFEFTSEDTRIPKYDSGARANSSKSIHLTSFIRKSTFPIHRVCASKAIFLAWTDRSDQWRQVEEKSFSVVATAMTASGVLKAYRQDVSACRVSTIIYNHNNGAHIESTVNAIRAQTLQPAQIFVIDDASLDGSGVILDCLRTKYPEVSFISNGVRLGLAQSVAGLIPNLSGTHLSVLKSGDQPVPSMYASMAQLLINHPESGCAVTNVEAIKTEDFVPLRGACLVRGDRWGGLIDYDEMLSCLMEREFDQKVLYESASLVSLERLKYLGGIHVELGAWALYFAYQCVAFDGGVLVTGGSLLRVYNRKQSVWDMFEDEQLHPSALSDTECVMRMYQIVQELNSPKIRNGFFRLCSFIPRPEPILAAMLNMKCSEALTESKLLSKVSIEQMLIWQDPAFNRGEILGLLKPLYDVLKLRLAHVPSLLAGAAERYEQGRFQESLDIFKVVLDISPDETRAKVGAALSGLSLGLIDGARQHLAGVDDGSIFDARTLNQLAVAHYQLGDVRRGRSILERANRLFPNDSDVLNNLSQIVSAYG